MWTIAREAGYIAVSGRIVDATPVSAPKQRDGAAEKITLMAGGTPVDWTKRPARLRQKDRRTTDTPRSPGSPSPATVSP